MKKKIKSEQKSLACAQCGAPTSWRMDCVTWQCRSPIDLQRLCHMKNWRFSFFLFHPIGRRQTQTHRAHNIENYGVDSHYIFPIVAFRCAIDDDSGSSPWMAMRKMIIIDLKDIHFSKFVFLQSNDGSFNVHRSVMPIDVCNYFIEMHFSVWRTFESKTLKKSATTRAKHRVFVAEAGIVVTATAAENIMHIKFKLMIWWVLWAEVYGRNV